MSDSSSVLDPGDASTMSPSDDEDSNSEVWVTAYDSEFDITLSDIDDDLLEAMRNLNFDEIPRFADAGGSQDDETQYAISNGGTTSNWSQAVIAQHGGAEVHATTKRKKVRTHKPWAVVIVGRPPGIYTARQATAAVNGSPNAIFQGYPSRDSAENAWAAAQEAGLVGSPDGGMPPNVHLNPLPLESHRPPPLSPLSTPGDGRRYYPVYRGRFTGIFNSSLEAGLSVVGVPRNSHESCRSFTVALHKFQRAMDRGEVAIIQA